MSGLLERIPVTALATRVIASVDPGLAAALGLEARHSAIAMLTTDCDDVGYIAIDEATKKAHVDVVYAASFYAGSAHASGPFSGEFIGILAAENPADASAGLHAAVDFAQNEAAFEKAAPGGPAFLAHLVSSCGTYLSAAGNIPVGSALAYLIAPPLEATFGLDAALKAKSLDARRLMSELDDLTRGTPLAADLADLVQAVQQLHYGQAQASLEACVMRLTDKG